MRWRTRRRSWAQRLLSYNRRGYYGQTRLYYRLQPRAVVAIVDWNLRYLIHFEKAIDLLGWICYTSEKPHHIDLDVAREYPAYKCVYRLSRAACTTDEHGELVVRLLERNVIVR